MNTTKIQKDSCLFMTGSWSAEKYAREIVKNASNTSCFKKSQYFTVNKIGSVASKQLSISTIREKISK